MFDFLFGGKKKIEFIRELVEQRMRDLGFDDMDSRLKVKQLSNLELIGTPEAGIVTVLEAVIKMQKQGISIRQILESIENHRKNLGHDAAKFSSLLNLASGSSEEAGSAVPMYCFYRLNMEAPGRMSEEQFFKTFEQIVKYLL